MQSGIDVEELARKLLERVLSVNVAGMVPPSTHLPAPRFVRLPFATLFAPRAAVTAGDVEESVEV